jgi:hypothetical protein
MARDIRDPADGYELVDYRSLASDWPSPELDFRDDRLLGTLYDISEWVITFLGPIFWICLVYCFLAAELSK